MSAAKKDNSLDLEVNTLQGEVSRMRKDVDENTSDIEAIVEKISNLPLLQKIVFGLTGTILTAVILAILGLVILKPA